MSTPILRSSILIILVLQTSLTVLILRYCRSHSNGEPFIPTTVVFLTEVMKYLLCLLLLLYQNSGSITSLVTVFMTEVVRRPSDTLLLAIPACLYTLQNNLLILALTNLDAATYQVTYQMKILTTAGFSVWLLGKQLSQKQWCSLLLLVAGVVLVQMPATTSTEKDNNKVTSSSHLIGLLSVLVACFSSGFAGVFYERLVKQSNQPSVIIRNLQLGIFSLLFGTLGMVFYNGQDILTLGPFYGYNPAVVSVILLQAFGGLVVAATIKYADNILKGFATSASIVVSSLASWLVLSDLQPGVQFLLGTGLVIISSFLYGLNGKVVKDVKQTDDIV